MKLSYSTVAHYTERTRFELCEALDTNEFDNIGEAVLNGDGEIYITLNHWAIYRFYAEVHGIYPIAESKYWLAYDAGSMFGFDDDLFEMMNEDDCAPYEGYGDTYEKLMNKFLRSDAVDLLTLNYFNK